LRLQADHKDHEEDLTEASERRKKNEVFLVEQVENIYCQAKDRGAAATSA
jgi:hypothetical protein